MSARVARVLVADDHAPTRADIRELLERDPRFTVCASAADALEAVNAAFRERPDLCLIDVRMPGGGIAATWEITARLPRTRVIMLTVSREGDDLFKALRAGASGYLLKDIDADRLTHALCEVLAGDAAIPGSLVARLVEEFRERGPRRRALLLDGSDQPLTSREWQVLDLMRQGLTTADIAGRLVISDATVRSHVAGILRKLRVPDRKSAIRLFRDE